MQLIFIIKRIFFFSENIAMDNNVECMAMDNKNITDPHKVTLFDEAIEITGMWVMVL